LIEIDKSLSSTMTFALSNFHIDLLLLHEYSTAAKGDPSQLKAKVDPSQVNQKTLKFDIVFFCISA
jgi:hypothetical protein